MFSRIHDFGSFFVGIFIQATENDAQTDSEELDLELAIENDTQLESEEELAADDVVSETATTTAAAAAAPSENENNSEDQCENATEAELENAAIEHELDEGCADEENGDAVLDLGINLDEEDEFFGDIVDPKNRYKWIQIL